MNNKERYAFVKSGVYGLPWLRSLWEGDPKDLAEDDAITAGNIRQLTPWMKLPITDPQKRMLNKFSDDYRVLHPQVLSDKTLNIGTFVQRWSPEGSRKGQVPLYQNLDGSVTYPGSPTFNRI